MPVHCADLLTSPQTQEANYLFLLDLQEFCMQQLHAGALIKDAYAAVVSKIHNEKPELEQYFVKTLGFIVGIEFRESSYVIGPKCARPVKKDMIFSLSLGFSDIPDPKDKNKKQVYSLLLLDTVKAGQNGCAFLSDGTKSKNDVIFYFEGGEDKSTKSKPNGKEKKAPTKSTRSNAIMKSKLRNENKDDQQAAIQRREHQRELMEKRREAGLEKYADPDDAKALGETKKRWKRFESYPREAMLPDHVKDMKV